MRDRGPITFAEFMEVALYLPHGGYYTTGTAFGPQGDFYTAPMTHPAFGALVGTQLAQLWRTLDSPSPFWVIEPAAGNGRLAADIFDWSTTSDASFADALRYVTLDVGPSVRGGMGVRAAGLPVRMPHGVILANELLDSMPVHRVTVQDGVLRELRVGTDDGGALVDVPSDPTPGLAERLESLGVHLGEGHRAEVNLGLDDWMSEAVSALDTGYVLLIDYGHAARDYYAPSRNRGTLRCYYRHTLNMNPYQHVGAQDISVHVEFSSLRRAALAAGLTEANFTTQTDFLRGLGFDGLRTAIAGLRGLSAMERTANLRAVDTLVDPEGMGGFKVAVFAKDAPVIGAAAASETELKWSGAPPLLSADHMPLSGPAEPEMPTWSELLS